MLSISSDSYVRLSEAQLQSVRLGHLISGLDEDVPIFALDAAIPTAITGYSEWVSAGRPAITIGWDWQMLVSDGGVSLCMVGTPRSNVMLLDEADLDLGPDATSGLLASFVGGLNWQDEVSAHISRRYHGSAANAPLLKKLAP